MGLISERFPAEAERQWGSQQQSPRHLKLNRSAKASAEQGLDTKRPRGRLWDLAWRDEHLEELCLGGNCCHVATNN